MSKVELVRDRSICSRRERRYHTGTARQLLCETALHEGGVHRGNVIDLSTSGFRLLCEGSFEVGQSICTELTTDHSHGLYRGVVRRVEPWVDGQCVLGCSLTDHIPDSVLQELAAAGVVNRRDDDRKDLVKPAKISWQLREGEVDAELKDYSSGGMKLSASAPIPHDTRLRIRIEVEDGEFVLEGHSVWQTETDDDHLVGIAFTNRDAPALVGKMLSERDDVVDLIPTERSNNFRRNLAYFCAVAVCCLALLSL